MQPLDNWLIDLQSDPMFQILVRKLTNERPSLPPFNADKDNTEKWKVMIAFLFQKRTELELIA